MAMCSIRDLYTKKKYMQLRTSLLKYGSILLESMLKIHKNIQTSPISFSADSFYIEVKDQPAFKCNGPLKYKILKLLGVQILYDEYCEMAKQRC